MLNTIDIPLADRFDFPLGTLEERNSDKIPPGYWLNTNPFLHKYDLGYHPGIDINLNKNYWNEDFHKPVYSIANGKVTYSQRVFNKDRKPSSWGNLAVIQHTLPNGKHIYSRYGHIENPIVSVGQIVSRGEQIAQVGDAFGKFSAHLHFDISETELLLNNAPAWFYFDYKKIVKNFVDPIKFIKENRIVKDIKKYLVQATENLIIRSKPTKSSLPLVGMKLKKSTFVIIDEEQNGYVPLENKGYVFKKFLNYLGEVE